MWMKTIISAILALLAAVSCACGGSGEAQIGDPAAAPAEQTEEEPSSGREYVRATLYYTSDEGFLVPVTKLIPREEGIAKACLSYMISTPENVSAAREMGLMPVIPEGADIGIVIADGNASVDIRGIEPLGSAEEELAMVEGIVNTLTGFPTISTVTVTRDGGGGALENGVLLPVKQGEYPLNPEDGEVSVSSQGTAATLYFPNAGGSLTVPVTRRLGSGDIYSTVSALIKGAARPGLRSCFPENTLLLGAVIENGVVTLDLSEDFKAVADTEGLFGLAYETVFLTLAERFDLSELRFRVNGAEFEPEPVKAPGSINPAA